MRGGLLTALIGVFAVALAMPAAAQPADPCEHYIPTGQPLPRQDTVRMNRVIYDNPVSWRGHRVGTVQRGDQVEVLKECGTQLLIGLPNGAQGWLATNYLPHEEELAREAARRPPATPAECDLRFGQAQLAETCKQSLAQRQARADELAHSTPLSGDQLRDFAAGRTVTITGRPGQDGAPSREPLTRIFFMTDGELFSSIDYPQGPRLERGRWLVDGDKLCLVGSGMICSTARHIPNGQTILAMRNGAEFVAAADSGDPQGLVHQVSAVFPYAMPPPEPAGLSGLAHPYMGW